MAKSNGAINKAGLKRLILERAKVVRSGHKFSRVAMDECYEQVRWAMIAFIDRQLHALPSMGKTVKFQVEIH